MTYRSAILLCILWLINTDLKAGDSLSQWQHFNIDNGLPTNNIYSVLEDRMGYLWLATDNGVVRYNGYSFKLFNTNDGLPVNDAYKLMEDKSGRMWVYSLSRSFGFIKNDKYTEVKLPRPDRIIYPSDIFDQNGKIVFLYTDAPGFMYTLIFFSEKETKSFKVNRDRFRHIFFSKAGNFWAYDSLSRVYNYSFVAPKRTAEFLKMKPICRLPINLYHEIIRYPIISSTKNMLLYSGFKSQSINYIDFNTCMKREIDITNIDKRNSYCYLLTRIDDSMTLITDKFIYVFDTNLIIRRKEGLPSVKDVGSQVSYRIKDRNYLTWYSTTNNGIWCNTNIPNILRRSRKLVGSSRVDLQACKLEYSIVSPK